MQKWVCNYVKDILSIYGSFHSSSSAISRKNLNAYRIKCPKDELLDKGLFILVVVNSSSTHAGAKGWQARPSISLALRAVTMARMPNPIAHCVKVLILLR